MEITFKILFGSFILLFNTLLGYLLVRKTAGLSVKPATRISLIFGIIILIFSLAIGISEESNEVVFVTSLSFANVLATGFFLFCNHMFIRFFQNRKDFVSILEATGWLIRITAFLTLILQSIAQIIFLFVGV